MSETQRAYSGLFGAFPYAYRESESRLFRIYAVVGGLLALLVAVLFTFALVVAFGNTSGATGGTFTFSRTLFVLVGFFAVGPLVGPVLFVARQHRTGNADPRYDAAMAAMGFLFVVSLYVGAVVSIPAEFTLDGETVDRGTPTGLFAPVVGLLYALPPLSSVVPPVLVAVGMVLLHRRLG